jgi:hypothetical protein
MTLGVESVLAATTQTLLGLVGKRREGNFVSSAETERGEGKEKFQASQICLTAEQQTARAALLREFDHSRKKGQKWMTPEFSTSQHLR